MKKSHTVSLLLASLLLSISGLAVGAAHTQPSGPAPSAEMVKMDRDTFLSMFRWDDLMSNWVLKNGMSPPKGVKTRSEIISMRDEYLSMHVWNEVTSDFEPVQGGKPRIMSTLDREQVMREGVMFNMMFRFDSVNSKWVKNTK
jgi:hypothetical protein